MLAHNTSELSKDLLPAIEIKQSLLLVVSVYQCLRMLGRFLPTFYTFWLFNSSEAYWLRPNYCKIQICFFVIIQAIKSIAFRQTFTQEQVKQHHFIFLSYSCGITGQEFSLNSKTILIPSEEQLYRSIVVVQL